MLNLSGHRLIEDRDIPSPALLVYPDKIKANLQRMIQMVGDVSRLRPHIKTHKMRHVLDLKKSLGIDRVKCATIAEAELSAQAGIQDVFLAYQPVGPAIPRLAALIEKYPATRFSAMVDCQPILSQLQEFMKSQPGKLTIFVDVDCGMHRSGRPVGRETDDLYRALAQSTVLRTGGIHAYDGHIRDQDPDLRSKECEKAMDPIHQWTESLRADSIAVPTIMASGTPTFPIHARHGQTQCCPGTCVLWDAGYARHFTDLAFEFAALVLSRVISKPGPNRITLDLGHKAIASENPHPRVIFPDLADARAVGHSEEHLILESDLAPRIPIGQSFYGIPWHICPTVALYEEAIAVTSGHATDTWPVGARARRLTI